MCGLVGVFAKYGNGMTNDHRDVFTTLLMIDALRGEDSTGAMLIHNNGDVSIAKEASVSGNFLRTEEFKELHRKAWTDGAAFIGHNRKATRGDVTDENAHPFIVDDKVVLVHNGGIWGDHKKLAEVEVDSHAIAHLMAEKSVEEALGSFNGAYALMWYDVENESVKIIRNKERPLWWMETNNAWVWASEKAMLMFTAARLNLNVTRPPVQIDEDTLIEFQLKDKRWEVSNRKITKKYPHIGNFNGGQKNVMGGDFRSWQDQIAVRDSELFNAQNDSCSLPQDREELNESGRPSSKLDRPSALSIGGHSFENTSTFERLMAKSCNKMITMGEFNEVIHGYPTGTSAVCECFEWVDDNDGGFYVYASPLDDPQIIFRHHFKAAGKPTEERMMTMALNGWCWEFIIATKCWSDFIVGKKKFTNTDEGYCIITTSGAKLVKGGGVQSLDVKEKADA